MATPPLDLTTQNWGARLTQLVNSGVPIKQIKKVVPIAKNDIQAVQQGGQAMGKSEATLALVSGIKGKPVLHKSEDEGGFSLDKVIGDVTSDIADLTWHGVPALASYVANIEKHAVDTATALSKQSGSKADQAWMKEHGYERLDPLSMDPSSWARQLRNVARTPLLGIIPGVNTAAGLTTEKGRNELIHHPVFTALDVIPYAQAASKAAGLASKAGAVEGSAAEAALQMKPGKALYRKLVPEARRAKIATKTLEGMRRVGLDPESFPLSREFDTESRRALVERDELLKESGVMDDLAKMSDEERLLFSKELDLPDQYPDMSPEHRALADKVKAFGDKLADLNPNLVRIKGDIDVPVPDRRVSPSAGPRERRTRPRAEALPDDARYVMRDEKGTEITALGDMGLDHAFARRAYETEIARRPGSVLNIEDAEGNIIRQGGTRVPEQAKVTTVETDIETPRFVVKSPSYTNKFGDVVPEQTILVTPDVSEARGAAAFIEREGHGAAVVDIETPRGSLKQEVRPVEPSPEPPTRKTTVENIYAADSPVAKAQRAAEKATLKVDKVTAEANVRLKGETAIELQRRMKKLDLEAQRVARAERRVAAARAEVGRAETSAKGRGTARVLDNGITRLEKALANLETRKAKAFEAGEAVNSPTNRSIEAQNRRVADAQAKAKATADEFNAAFKANPPASMMPMLQERLRAGVEAQVRMQPWALDEAGNPIGDKATTEFVDDAITALERGDKHGLMTPEDYMDLKRSIMQDGLWQELAAQGNYPIWTHNVPVNQAGRVPNTRPMPLKNPRASMVRARVGDTSPKIQDVAVSIGRAADEYIRAKSTKRWLDTYITPRTQSWAEIRDFLHNEVDLMKAKGKVPRGVDDAGALQLALEKHYVDWNPNRIFETQKPRLSGTATLSPDGRYLPKHLAKIADDLIQPYNPNAFVRGAAKTTKLYKTSIMAFSLKHMAHIALGGTIMLAGRGGIDEIMNLAKANKMVREGTMPIELSRHTDFWESPDQMWQLASGSKLGKLYDQSLGRFANAKQKFDEFFVNWQRATAYLGEESRATRRGLTPEAAKEAGLQHAYKTLVDIDGMNPMERNVLRQVLPFYAFMRHTLKYVLTYPIDHPMRAAILSRISDIEEKDWSSGLPQSLQSLFFMGQPDGEGNITGIEMKQFNPFRDTGSYFTLAGFIKSIHPLAQLPFQLAGVDKFAGASELYPEMEYNAHTGNLQAKRPPNAGWNVATTIVPELGLIDHFGGITQDMRKLKARDPEAYKRRLYNMLFVPFEPKKINIPQEAADIQRKLYQTTQQDVSETLSTGNTGALAGYPLVPYQGELVQPEALGKLVDYIKQIRPDQAPRSALPPVKLSSIING